MTLYDSEGKYRPSKWVLGPDHIPPPKPKKPFKPRKQGQGIYIPLNTSTRCRFRILKTEMGFDTWQQLVDQILKDYSEGQK